MGHAKALVAPLLALWAGVAVAQTQGGSIGNAEGAPITFETGASKPLLVERVRITSSGLVGIGTATPTVALDVSGSVLSRVYNAGSSTSIDWSTANVAYTSANCGAFTFSNMNDGGSYSLIVTGTTSGNCSFTHTGLTVKAAVSLTTAAGKQTVFSFLRAGSNLYVSMVPNF